MKVVLLTSGRSSRRKCPGADGRRLELPLRRRRGMNRNMKQWAADLMAAPVKKPLPLLSFPCVQLMDITVQQLIGDSALQARGMKLVAVVPVTRSISCERAI